jgi:hypothetical protein
MDRCDKCGGDIIGGLGEYTHNPCTCCSECEKKDVRIKELEFAQCHLHKCELRITKEQLKMLKGEVD